MKMMIISPFLVAIAVFGVAAEASAVREKTLIDAGASALAPSMSTIEIKSLCASYDFKNVTDDAHECSIHCEKHYYSKKYDYTGFLHCYRCCFSGGDCIPPVKGGAACTGNGLCVKTEATKDKAAVGKCQCNINWAGDFCERLKSACPRYGKKHLVCAGHGNCVNAKCACSAGFGGVACEKKLCPANNGKECSGQPCNYKTGQCRCGTLWKTANCGVAACPLAPNGKECNGVGKCGNDHRCQCGNSGYFGDACHKKQCPKDNQGRICGGSHHGHCDQNGSGKCHCRPGLTGPACAGIQCGLVNGKPCGGTARGRCSTEKGVCVCNRSWAGINCERPSCPRPTPGDSECGDNGVCLTTMDKVTKKQISKCRCDSKHSGPACAWVICPKDAHGNECHKLKGQGTCDGKTGTCKCSKGFTGPACGDIMCHKGPNGKYCTGNGSCDFKTGKCVCAKMWKGHRCHVRACPGFPQSECSKRGECNNGRCLCTKKWKGAACEHRTCPAANGIECNLQGACNPKTGKCACNNKWRGNSCQEKICLFSKINGKECGGNGKCVKGLCQCNSGWRDHACDNKICPFHQGRECNKQGACVKGKCRCHAEWRGPACGTYYQARFGSADSLANYKKSMTTRKAYKSSHRRTDFASKIDVIKGDLYEVLLTCNLANIHISTNQYRHGNVYMRAVIEGAATVLGTPSLGVAANVGTWQPVSSLGMFRASGNGEVTVQGEYWSGTPSLAGTFVYCGIGAFRVGSGRAVYKENGSHLSISDGKRVNAGTNKYTEDMGTTINVKRGEKVHVLLSCGLWNTGGGTTYMRVVPTSGSAKEVLPGNWITSTIKVGGGWSQGVSQGVYEANTDGPLTFKGVYHVGSSTGTYGGCGATASIVNGTIAATSSASKYSRTWSTRLVTKNAVKTTDFSTTISVTKGDFVRVILSANLLETSGNTAYMRVVRTGGTAGVKVITPGNWITTTQQTSSNGVWHPGVSQGVYRATGTGTITFAGTYHTGGTKMTYVYSNIYAENLGAI